MNERLYKRLRNAGATILFAGGIAGLVCGFYNQPANTKQRIADMDVEYRENVRDRWNFGKGNVDVMEIRHPNGTKITLVDVIKDRDLRELKKNEKSDAEVEYEEVDYKAKQIKRTKELHEIEFAPPVSVWDWREGQPKRMRFLLDKIMREEILSREEQEEFNKNLATQLSLDRTSELYNSIREAIRQIKGK
ncbi:hypothetical protein HZA33_04245 [Candidatus Pacearchaeota archaeon]|nr:hypothetical protein [Candidatus Pacearchaeota archaeon]